MRQFLLSLEADLTSSSIATLRDRSEDRQTTSISKFEPLIPTLRIVSDYQRVGGGRSVGQARRIDFKVRTSHSDLLRPSESSLTTRESEAFGARSTNSYIPSEKAKRIVGGGGAANAAERWAQRNTASAEPEQAAEASTAAAEPNAAGVLWPLPRRIPPDHCTWTRKAVRTRTSGGG
jgi:hypothetical protein